MGTDIHAYVAIRDYHGEWKTASFVRKNKYYDPQSTNQFDSRAWELAEIYLGRDYVLFDALSNVRGCDYPPLAHPGLDDAPVEILAEHELWRGDDHDAGWVSLAELCSAVKNKKVYDKGDEFWDGPHASLKSFRNTVEAFAGAWDYYNTEDDVRVYFWYDS